MPELKRLNLDSRPQDDQPLAGPTSAPTPLKTPLPVTSLPKATPQSKSMSPLMKLIPVIVIILLGVSSGFALSRFGPGASTQTTVTSPTTAGGIKVGDTFGSDDEKSFKDSAEGVLDKGGINGEGSHKLLRAGGESQTVYLTSSVVDLDEFVGHKVKIWGDTFSARKAGWLMDVGRVKVLELDAPKP
ncbi:hypothetical protein A2368_00625 [Candidatus Collierbacteria bacterium RIFOXYB1_FULL_49_13]|uniref:Uncharacterized protein n=1 Tax=Candidatus Collierbacteria bacterium RIFOXYB1_FULL_49_13 TaxID=1817728 RepID=A0A1F5FHK9_9BACT|nr:MAG: hypothetical protein A2368_00625 [Candidatus Collierbacteria bacterium RIFOXYB1_FULL_49_13]